MKLHIREDYEIESSAYNLDNKESRRKEIADRFGKEFIPDNHILRCKDNKELNIQVGKKYKCTATNGQRVEIVSIDDIFDDNSALVTAYYRGKMLAIGSMQLYESNTKNTNRKYIMKESGWTNGAIPIFDTTDEKELNNYIKDLSDKDGKVSSTIEIKYFSKNTSKGMTDFNKAKRYHPEWFDDDSCIGQILVYFRDGSDDEYNKILKKALSYKVGSINEKNIRK